MPFELAEPRSLREAIASLDAKDPSVRPISGGTALMLMMKAGVLRPSRLVSLGKLDLAGIRTGPGGELRVGAMTSLRTIEKSEIVRSEERRVGKEWRSREEQARRKAEQ